MGLLTKLTVLALTVGSAFLFYKLLVEPHPAPKVADEYWGPKSEQGKKEDISIRSFKIDIKAPALDDLKARLKKELDSDRLLPPLEGIGFEYGFNTKFLAKVGQHWLNKYDWKAREKLLNKYPQFKTKVGGLDIHFQHIKPKSKNGVTSRPLLLLHGWPGSIVEFQKIIPLLSEPKDSKHNYELVIPSLPGYGFSTAASRRGLSTTEMGNIFKRLMQRLGHEQFYVMGGDWGGIITGDMATIYPENVIAAQSNLCFVSTVLGNLKNTMATWLPDMLMSEDEKAVVLPFSETVSFMARETGYAHIHMTKPDTVGVGLTHSPLGLAAYILEKFSTWTDRTWISREDGGLLENFTIDELLDNVMVYWVTGSMTSSVRLYAESILQPSKIHDLDRVPTNVPFSCQFMKDEILVLPQFALKDKYTNIQKYTISPRGGHFGAFEAPDLVAENAISHFENN